MSNSHKKLNVALDIDETVVNISPKLHKLLNINDGKSEIEILKRDNFYLANCIDDEYYKNGTFYEDLELNEFGKMIKKLYDGDRLSSITFFSHHKIADEFKASMDSKIRFINDKFPNAKIEFVDMGINKSIALSKYDWDSFTDDRVDVIRDIILSNINLTGKKLQLLLYNYNFEKIDKLGGLNFIQYAAQIKGATLDIIDPYNFHYNKVLVDGPI